MQADATKSHLINEDGLQDIILEDGSQIEINQ